MRPLTVLSWNFENNGNNDPDRRRAGYETLASLRPDLIFRQEMRDSGEKGQQVFAELETLLGMRGWLGRDSCTAIFANPDRFALQRNWCHSCEPHSPGPMWVLPPTALTMRYTPAGDDATPMVLVSYHLNYASATNRLTETEWLSTWADKKGAGADGQPVTLPALMGGDNNSYPAPGVKGDPPLPELAAIRDRPHRLHRSYEGPEGRRLMDTRPDTTLRMAGLEDVARHLAQQRGDKHALARTVSVSKTHGPDSRVDRVYASVRLLPAVTGVDVIEVPLDLSDHHIVRLELDADVLADILNEPAAVPA